MRKIGLAVPTAAMLIASAATAAAQCLPPPARCQVLCQQTWRAGGYASLKACYEKWGNINRLGGSYAASIEARNRAHGWRAPTDKK